MDKIERMQLFGNPPEDSGRSAYAHSYWADLVNVIDTTEEKAKRAEKTAGFKKELTDRLQARAWRDAKTELEKVDSRRERLRGELETLNAKYEKSKHRPNEYTLSAIWPKLPNDALELEVLYGDAISAKDFTTAAAIESIPLAFGGGVPTDRLEDLKRVRRELEDPHASAEIIPLESAVEAMDRAYNAASGKIDDALKDLPDPQQTDGIEISPDGLIQISPSQLAEATGA